MSPRKKLNKWANVNLERGVERNTVQAMLCYVIHNCGSHHTSLSFYRTLTVCMLTQYCTAFLLYCVHNMLPKEIHVVLSLSLSSPLSHQTDELFWLGQDEKDSQRLETHMFFLWDERNCCILRTVSMTSDPVILIANTHTYSERDLINIHSFLQKTKCRFSPLHYILNGTHILSLLFIKHNLLLAKNRTC